MFKIDQIKSLLDCEQCNQLLITIVCGYSVCKKHLHELLESSSDQNKFKCLLCHKQHTIPEEGFVVSRRIQKQIEIQLNKFKPNQAYEDCKKVLNEARNNIAEIEALQKDPDHYINETFEGFKKQVNIRREEIKSKVNLFRRNDSVD